MSESKAREVFYQVEYAKTNRSSCAKSKKQIGEGVLRIGLVCSVASLILTVLGRNSPSPFHDGYVTKWYLFRPFFEQTVCGTHPFFLSHFTEIWK